MNPCLLATPILATVTAEWESAPGLPFEWNSNPDLWLYRDRTLALLYRFFRSSMEAGRLPSVLGREFFRTQVTSYSLSSFEDIVIFVHDIERCLERLDRFSLQLIARVALQGYSQEEAARLMGCSRRTALRRFPEALDRLSEIFLEVGILLPRPAIPDPDPEPCQGGKIEEKSVTM